MASVMSQSPVPPLAQQGHYTTPSSGTSSTGQALLGHQQYGSAVQMPYNGSSQPFPYTSAPTSNSVPVQAPPALSQQQAYSAFQQQQHHVRQTPQQSQSPNAASHPTPPPHTNHSMAAPPLPQTPSSLQQGPVSTAAPSPRSPLSPGSQSRDDERVSLLFEINVELLQEVNRLQTEGHGGAISPQQLMQLRSEGKPDKMASEEYIQCLRRVQANLAWLMPRASNDPAGLAKAPPGPAHMTPPPHMAQLQSKYAQLTELFPGWKGLDRQPSQSASSPGLNGPNPMATNGMTSAPAQAQA